jgi:hypothetical protein
MTRVRWILPDPDPDPGLELPQPAAVRQIAAAAAASTAADLALRVLLAFLTVILPIGSDAL